MLPVEYKKNINPHTGLFNDCYRLARAHFTALFVQPCNQEFLVAVLGRLTSASPAVLKNVVSSNLYEFKLSPDMISRRQLKDLETMNREFIKTCQDVIANAPSLIPEKPKAWDLDETACAHGFWRPELLFIRGEQYNNYELDFNHAKNGAPGFRHIYGVVTPFWQNAGARRGVSKSSEGLREGGKGDRRINPVRAYACDSEPIL